MIAAKGSPIQPTVDSLKGKHVGVLQGSTREAYANETWRSKGVDVVAYANQDLVFPIWLQDVWMLRYKMKLLPVKDSSSNLLVKISPLLAHQ